jgi:hypothetical protein
MTYIRQVYAIHVEFLGHIIIYLPRPQSLSKGGEENEKKFFVGHISISHHALPGNDITATDLYRLQLHCTVPNEGPAEEADYIPQRHGRVIIKTYQTFNPSTEFFRNVLYFVILQ